MGNKDVIYDDGNEIIKGRGNGNEVYFAHASAKLSYGKYEEMVSQGDTSGLYIINEQPYVIDRRAERYGSVRHEGAKRYTPEYYKRFLGVTLFHLFEKSKRGVFLYASLPPKDNVYKDAIEGAALGTIKIEHQGDTKTFTVTKVKTWYEPVGGVMNRLMDGKGYRSSKDVTLHQGDTLVIDVGGLTIDYIVLENGAPDFSSARSFTERNIIDTLQDFQEMIRRRYPEELASARDLPIERVMTALHSGVYHAGAYGELDVRQESDDACHNIVDAIIARYEQYGGAQLDNILLTGGGSGLLERKIRSRMMIHGGYRKGVYLADEQKHIHLANIRGAEKLLAYYDRKGAKR